MGFVQGGVKGEKVFDGKVFPITYVPSGQHESSATHLIDVVASHRDSLSDALQRHGAVLFRGFAVGSAEDFSKVVEAFGWEEQPYPVSANRVRVCPRVYTATEFPLHVFISFHHEMSMIKESCGKIFFMCMQPPPEGGETSIVRSDVLVERMEAELPEAVEKFERDGMLSVIRFKKVYKKVEEVEGRPHDRKVWHQLFKTEDEEEAMKRAVEITRCNLVKLNSDGTADLTYGPFNPIKEIDGRRVWYNNITDYTTDEKEAHVTYGDCTPLPPEVPETYSRIIEENCVDVKWEKGDILLVDNRCCQHARRPGKPPRLVLVSLCK